MKSLVLEKKGDLSLRDFSAIDRIEENLGARDVRIKIHTVAFVDQTCIITPMGALGRLW